MKHFQIYWNCDGTAGEEDEEQALRLRALALAVKTRETSISIIQRKCGIGYNHSGRILEWMEEMGYVTPFDEKAKARKVLLTKEGFESKYGPLG